MGIFGRYGNTSDERFLELKHKIISNAAEQSHELKMNSDEAAMEIAKTTGMIHGQKTRDPQQFMDVALGALCYPPELAVTIILKFHYFDESFGFTPVGTIFVALAKIVSLYSGVMTRVSFLKENPEFVRLLEDKQIRIEKAGKTLAVAIYIFAEDIRNAKTIYHSQTFDSEVKVVVDRELRNIDAEIAKAIIG